MSVPSVGGNSSSQRTASSLPQPSDGLGPTDPTAEAVNEVAMNSLRELIASSEPPLERTVSPPLTLDDAVQNEPPLADENYANHDANSYQMDPIDSQAGSAQAVHTPVNLQDLDYSAIVAFFKNHLNPKIRDLANTVETVTKETILITSREGWQNDLGNSHLLATEIMRFLDQFRSKKPVPSIRVPSTTLSDLTPPSRISRGSQCKYALEGCINAKLQAETFVEKRVATDGSQAELHVYWVLELDSHSPQPLKNGEWIVVSETCTITVSWICSNGRRLNGYNVSVKLSWSETPCNGIEISRPPDKIQARRFLILPVTIAKVIQQKIPGCQFHQLPLFLCKRCIKIRLDTDKKRGIQQCCLQISKFKRKSKDPSVSHSPSSASSQVELLASSPKASRPSSAELEDNF